MKVITELKEVFIHLLKKALKIESPSIAHAKDAHDYFYGMPKENNVFVCFNKALVKKVLGDDNLTFAFDDQTELIGDHELIGFIEFIVKPSLTDGEQNS